MEGSLIAFASHRAFELGGSSAGPQRSLLNVGSGRPHEAEIIVQQRVTCSIRTCKGRQSGSLKQRASAVARV
jgi:hypothetical protein